MSGLAFETPYGNEHMEVGLSLSSAAAAPGDEITVSISLLNNYNATTLRFPVVYDNTFFEVAGTDGDLATPIDNVTALAGSASVTENDDEFVPASLGTDYSAYVIQWIAAVRGPAQEGGTLIAAFNSATAAVCFTFKLRVKADAEGSGTVQLGDTAKFYNTGVKDVTDATTVYNSATPFDYVVSEAQVCEISAGSPELVAAEGYNVQIRTFPDDDNEYLVGFDAEEIYNGGDFTDQFTVNGGTYSVSGDFGTGTVVTVYNPDSTVYATYTIIYFGDVTGDGNVDIDDYSVAILYMNWDIDHDFYAYAADLEFPDDNDVGLDIDDISTILLFSNFDIGFDDVSQTHFTAG